jgi:glycosyltransferase involved in cell wall biosynthesis
MGDGPLKNDFEKYALDNQLDVVFYGRVPYPKMCGLLASCDVCVNPITKGAAQSIINKHGDYAASGLPVISTQETSEYRELISDNNCGINCECSNHQEVAYAITLLRDYAEDRLIMGKNAKKMAEVLFDRNNSYLSVLKLFE